MTPPQGMSAEKATREILAYMRVQEGSHAWTVDYPMILETVMFTRADERVKAWNERGEADAKRIRAACTRCHGLGVKGIFLCGSCSPAISSIESLKLPEAQPVEPIEGEGT